MDTTEIMAAFICGVTAVTMLPIFLHFRGERRKRELEHIERMRAIEVGRSYPGEKSNSFFALPPWAVPHLIAITVGAGVPIGVFACAFLASVIGGFQQEIWMAAGMVGLGGVIGGSTLAVNAFRSIGSNAEPEYSDSFAHSKPHVDEDAYDVVSSRA
jgi:hypothetical protein